VAPALQERADIMMRILFALTFSLAFYAVQVQGAESPATRDSQWTPEFRLGPRVGPGELRIRQGERIGDEIVSPAVSEDTIGVGGTLEYKAPFGLVVEGGLFTAGSTDWFDSDDYRLSEYFGSIGFEIPLGRGFTLTPRTGRARWKLESDSVWFFDDDDEAPTSRGYQNYWEVTALKRINRTLALGVSHRENHYDFGRVRSTVFTAMFSL
jgi:hypothetical protein